MMDIQFYEQLQKGPILLLLGQNSLCLETGTDPLLTVINRKYGLPGQTIENYTQMLSLFQTKSRSDLDNALAWMAGRNEYITAPAWLNIVAGLAWSGVYTSAIDNIWPQAFESEWRTLQPLLSIDYNPPYPRNRSLLPCTYLYGCINRKEEAERSPITIRDLARRRRDASAFLGRLPEILTPFGTLLIEGYAGGSDWLQIDELLSVLEELNPGQTHLFSASGQIAEDLIQHSYANEFVQESKLILHHESLATCLLQGAEGGHIRLGERYVEQVYQRQILIGEKSPTTLSVEPDLWNQTSRSALILDEELLLSPPPVSEAKLYQEFRAFLAESSTMPVWTAYARDFAFKRLFEDNLFDEVKKRLGVISNRELQREPIVLHGQTGTGKTVALGRLAYRIRMERRYPVLFIERKAQRPLYEDIDAFSKWAEDNGSEACLVIWDGMEDIEQYYSILHYLVGRGRKLVLVGSCYTIAQTPPKKNGERRRKSLVEAPAKLQPEELVDFDHFLRRFNLMLDEDKPDEAFLVALYQLVPFTRPQIITGLLSEVRYSKQRLRQFAQQVSAEPIFESALALAMYRAGLIGEQALSSARKEFAGEDLDDYEKLIGLVMVPGCLGLNVPIELLLRALGKHGTTNIVSLLKHVGIFHWHEDRRTGNITIGPRHSLEARLIMFSTLGGARFEIQYAQQLLLQVRDSDNSQEIRFAIDLVHYMRPEERLGTRVEENNEQTSMAGRLGIRYVPFYLDLAATLGKLREDHNICNPRLMLQESTLLREAAKRYDILGHPLDEAEGFLLKAEEINGLALQILEETPRTTRLRSMILVELASVRGTRIRQMLTSGNLRKKEAQQLLALVRDEVFKAHALDKENYYPIDVLAWATSDMLEKVEVSPAERAIIAADILYLFEDVNIEDLSSSQRERYYIRRMDIARILGQADVSDEAFTSLQALGSRAGYYVRAYQKAGLKLYEPITKPLNELQRVRCQEAVQYLEEHRLDIANDERCLFLLLRLWWLSLTSKPIFYQERQVLPFTQEEWLYCYLLLQDLSHTEQAANKPSIKYLLGLAAFHTENINEAFEIFHGLEREAEYIRGQRRIIRSYLASKLGGEESARVFTGTVSWVDHERNRGEIYVEQLFRTVRFLPLDFNRPNIHQHDAIRFHLAFNYLGPVADPLGLYKGQKDRHK